MTKKTNTNELFDYRKDHLEQHDLAPDHADEIRQLETALENWQERVSATRLETSKAGPLDSQTLKQLKTLGYID